MEVYNAAAQEYTDAYMLQSNGLTGHYAPQDLDQFGAMYREGMPEFVVDQGMYYPTPANYGYVCTGLESPVEWDDRQMVFGLDGLDVHYPGAESENSPFVYCTPNVAFAQSPYNPYNPYIPGAMLGVDGSFMGAQQYYNLPSYDNQSSSPMYFPMLVQSRSDVNAHNTSFSFVDTISSTAYRADRPSLKNNLSSASPAFNVTPWLSAANQSNSHRRASEGNSAVAGSSRRSVAKGSSTSSGLFHPASAPNINGRSAQGVENVAPGKTLASRTQAKVGLSSGNAFSSYRPSIHALSTADKVQSKFNFGKVHNETRTCADKPREQNQVPKIDISGNKLTVRAFTSRAGDADTHGNITIHLDQYDKNDSLVDYPNAKFFIIKSYSEDDVHKSIKYNVWSSTPNGNKKLNSAYEGAQRISHAATGSCPIFLFFSVNASGQFCGVAEMTGPVDFHKDMDFWQQDKWTGSFPVKWHIVKDVPNFNFRHIILENNDNKPVTNSRDTQEVPYNKGTEMLKIFRSYLSKTSLLDDFLYYENRQRILQEEKTRLLLKKFNSPFFVAIQEPPRKHNSASDEDKITRPNGSTSSSLDKGMVAAADENSIVDKGADANIIVDKGADADSIVVKDADADSIADEGADADSIADKGADANSIVDKGAVATKIVASVLNGEANMEEALKIGSLTLTSTYSGSGPLEDTTSTVSDSASNDVVTVGSIPVKVNGYAEPSGFLTVGTIQFDPRVGQDLIDGSLKRGTRKG